MSLVNAMYDYCQDDCSDVERNKIEQYFRKSYDEINLQINRQLEVFKDNHSDFGYGCSLILFSEFFYKIEKKSEDSKVKFNARKIRENITKQLINLFASPILTFFKWDLSRRVWQSDQRENKLKFLRESIDEASLELEGKSENVFNKYITLFIEFITDYLEKGLFSQENIDQIIATKVVSDPFELPLKLNEIKDGISDFLDKDQKKEAMRFYQPVARKYLDGLLAVNGRYNYLLISFLDALNHYRNYLRIQLDVIENYNQSECEVLRKNIECLEIEEFIARLKALFADLANEVVKNTNEAYYHVFIHLVMKLIGCSLSSEISTNLGRIDSVLETNTSINIIEFKMSSSKEAISQILEKKYYQKYLGSKKQVNLLGIAFDSKEKNIADYRFIENYTPEN